MAREPRDYPDDRDEQDAAAKPASRIDQLVDGVWTKLIARGAIIFTGAVIAWASAQAPAVIRTISSIDDKLVQLMDRMDGQLRQMGAEMKVRDARIDSHEKEIDNHERRIDDLERRQLNALDQRRPQ